MALEGKGVMMTGQVSMDRTRKGQGQQKIVGSWISAPSDWRLVVEAQGELKAKLRGPTLGWMKMGMWMVWSLFTTKHGWTTFFLFLLRVNIWPVTGYGRK